MRRLLLAILLALVPSLAGATVTQLVGTITYATGTPVNGSGCFRLPVNAIDTSTNRALSPTTQCFTLANGVFPASASLVPNDVIQPSNTFYQFTAFNTSHTPVFMANYVIPTGSGTFNLGLAVPTSVTTNNVSFMNQLQAIGIPTFTMKTGSNSGGTYTTSVNTLADVDGTNLAYTVTVPIGWKLSVVAKGDGTPSTDYLVLQLFDTQGSAVLDRTVIGAGASGSANFVLGFSMAGLVVGDGLSHTIKLQFANISNSTSVGVVNGLSTGRLPRMLFDLSVSN